MIKAGFSPAMIVIPIYHGDGIPKSHKCYHGDFDCIHCNSRVSFQSKAARACDARNDGKIVS